MRNMIVTMILLLTLVRANGIVARTANAADNPCIACQNRCLKLDPANYGNCKLKCKGSSVCLGRSVPSSRKRSRQVAASAQWYCSNQRASAAPSAAARHERSGLGPSRHTATASPNWHKVARVRMHHEECKNTAAS